MAASPTPIASGRDSDLEAWTARLGHLLWEVSTLVELEGEAALAHSPLSLASNGILDVIIARPGVTVAEISRWLPTTQQAVSQVVARLQRLGFIERRLGSGRGVGLHVTPAGEAAHDEAHRREEAVDARLRDRLGVKRHDDLRRLLGEARQLLEEDS